jgi:hypothetical protein
MASVSTSNEQSKSFVISHELSTKIALERVRGGGGFAPLAFSPFLITPASDKETSTPHKEFILAAPIGNPASRQSRGRGWERSPVMENNGPSNITILAVAIMAGHVNCYTLTESHAINRFWCV